MSKNITLYTFLLVFKIVESLQSTLKVGLSFLKIYFLCFNESPLKVIKNYFYFVLKALKKWLDYKDKVHFKIYDVATGLTNNYNTQIAPYLSK